MNWLKRLFRSDPVTYSDGQKLWLRTHAPTMPKATVFEIKNPRLELARRRRDRIERKGRSAL